MRSSMYVYCFKGGREALVPCREVTQGTATRLSKWRSNSSQLGCASCFGLRDEPCGMFLRNVFRYLDLT